MVALDQGSRLHEHFLAMVSRSDDLTFQRDKQQTKWLDPSNANGSLRLLSSLLILKGFSYSPIRESVSYSVLQKIKKRKRRLWPNATSLTSASLVQTLLRLRQNFLCFIAERLATPTLLLMAIGEFYLVRLR